MNNKILKKIDVWKKNLLDLSKRNPLISFRAPRRTSIRIIDELPSEVFSQIVLDENKFEFLPKKNDDSNFYDDENDDNQDHSMLLGVNQKTEEEIIADFFNYSKDSLDSRHTDNFLQTNLDEKNLFLNLRSIEDKSRTIINEQGYNNLFLTLGMIEWYDNETSQIKYRSPLILVPVQLIKKTIKSPYSLIRSDEDPLMNMSLQLKFSEEFGIKLPELDFSDDFDPQEYISNVQELISKNKRWKVKNDIFLGFFSFASFVMYKDLEAHLGIYKDNSIIQALSGVSDSFDNINYPDAIEGKDLDKLRHPKDVYHVMDADSSQDEAIELVKTGRNLVIKGPPGTGKSQTIANIIADNLGNGKSVLFVSEKMAALNVVYKRLHLSGLSDFCLELHSRKANKKHIISQIKSAYDFMLDKMPNRDYLIDLKDHQDKINNYVDFIHKPINQIGNKSMYWLIGQLNNLSNIKIIDFEIENLDKTDFKMFEENIKILTNIENKVLQIKSPSEHPYYGSFIDETNEYHQQKFDSTINDYKTTFSKFMQLVDNIKNCFSIDINTIDEVKKYLDLIEVLLKDHQVPLKLLKLKNFDTYYLDLQPVIDKVEDVQNTNIINFFDTTILNEDLNKIKRKLKGEYSSFTRYFKPQYYKTVNLIKGYANKDISIFSYDNLLNDLTQLIDYQNNIKFISNIDKNLTEPLDNLWKKENTNLKKINKTLDWLKLFHNSKVNKSDISSFEHLIQDSNHVSNEVIGIKDKLEKIVEIIINDITEIEKLLKIDKKIIYDKSFINTSLNKINLQLSDWSDNISELVTWSRYIRAYKDCKSVGLDDYVDNQILLDEHLDQIVVNYKKKYFFTIFEKIKKDNKIIKNFDALEHDALIDVFQYLDKEHIKLSKYRILRKLIQNRPDKNLQGSKSSELGILQKQFRLKRRHLPLRKLFTKSSNIIQKICPCFMMSPMSVSQYINPSILNFDLVIFDEASQIKPEHSVGSIIRGNQLVVVGDEKQLPPTSFFSREIMINENDDDPLLPSVLDEVLTLSCFSESDLRWHYRSRDESLIHFSNVNFYNNRLNTFPNSSTNNFNSGVELEYIKDSFYDRGGKQTNEIEARAIVKEIYNHYKNNPELSIGVVALSTNQRKMISDILYQEVFNNSEFEQLLKDQPEDEELFIKNLETVQGDERDVILISIGYGKDKNGRLYMNFGPINREGGWRRLNVLITRSRLKIKVFSSILGKDFDLRKTSSKGVKMLKEYLEYAESNGTKILDENHTYGELDTENPFELSVANQLKLEGINFIPQVGQSGYKIDFGILDPNDGSKFILALECDGASYHSSATARDRDRIRQSVLEGLGWRFHRIWSTDWFQNHKKEMDRLKEKISNSTEKYVKSKTDVDSLINFDDLEELELESSGSRIKLINYAKYQIKKEDIKSSDSFYEEASSSSFYIEDLIIKVLRVEHPIHKKELSLRVIEHFDMSVVGGRIRRIMETYFSRLKSQNKIKIKNDFIYYKSMEINFVRKRNIEDSIDIITLISDKEIENAIIYILENEIRVPKNELITQVSSLFGYKNTGQRIKSYITNIIRKSRNRLIKFDKDDLILIDK